MSRCVCVLGFRGGAIKKPPSIKRKVLRLHNIHRRNQFGETHLHLAVMKGDLQSVKDMIEAGASVNLADNAGTLYGRRDDAFLPVDFWSSNIEFNP